jgi:hypothetical protein
MIDDVSTQKRQVLSLEQSVKSVEAKFKAA